MQKRMIQQVMTAPGEISFREIPVPVAGPEQILVRTKRIGICGSDIHVYHGKHPYTSYPVTQGHEISGEIAAVGSAVTGFSVGQRVTIEPQVACGTCYNCRHGRYNICEQLKVMGFQTTGAASEYFSIDQKRVDLLPDNVDDDQGAMVEPAAVAVHAVRRSGPLKGQKVVVLGAGPIGNLVAQAAKAVGAAQVMITDVSDFRLAIAKDCGTEFTVNTGTVDLGAAIEEHFGADRADVIYDCAGNDITMGQAIRFARKGSTIILVAVYAGTAHVDLAMLNDHELDLNTTMMYTRADFTEAIQFIAEGTIRLHPLMSRHFAFADFLDAYRYIDSHREMTLKVLIDVESE
mgnify:CR=1 FL=1